MITYPDRRKKVQIFSRSYAARVKNLLGSGLVGYWKLDELTGIVAYDSSQSLAHGDYIGPTLGANANPPKIGKFSPGFDGVNDRVNMPAAIPLFNSAEHTFMAWVKPYSVSYWTDGVYKVTMSFYATGNDYAYLICTGYATSKYTWLEKRNGLVKVIELNGISYTDWFHVAITLSQSSDRMRAYINGAQTGLDVTSVGPFTPAPIYAMIGSLYAATQPHRGGLAHAMLMDREATAAEIAQVYNWGA